MPRCLQAASKAICMVNGPSAGFMLLGEQELCAYKGASAVCESYTILRHQYVHANLIKPAMMELQVHDTCAWVAKACWADNASDLLRMQVCKLVLL